MVNPKQNQLKRAKPKRQLSKKDAHSVVDRNNQEDWKTTSNLKLPKVNLVCSKKNNTLRYSIPSVPSYVLEKKLDQDSN